MLTLPILGLAVRSLALLFLATLTAVSCCHASASVKRLIWLLGILSVVALPFVWRLAPEVSLAPKSFPGFQTALDQPVVASAIQGLANNELQYHPVLEASPTAAPATSQAIGKRQLLLTAWGGVSTLLLLRLLFGLASAGLMVRKATPFYWRSFSRLLKNVGIKRPVRLVVTDEIAIPATTGAWRPVILLPKGADRWSDEKMQIVLAHELAHVRQLDWLFSLAAQLVCVMYPFNPLVWIGAYRFRIESEMAADDRALNCGIKATDYARGLLDIAQLARQCPATVVSMAKTTRVESRLRAVVDGHRRRGRAAFTSIVGLAMVTIALCTALAAIRVGDIVSAKAAATNDSTKLGSALTNPAINPMTIQVLDVDGRPCPGAKLYFCLTALQGYSGATTVPPPVTDSNGNFELHPEELRDTSNMPKGYFSAQALFAVMAYRPGRALSPSGLISTTTRKVVIRLTKPNAVRILLLDPTNHPAAGVRLTAHRIVGNKGGGMTVPVLWRKESFQAISNSAGIAEFHDLPAKWSLKFSVDDSRYEPIPVDQKNPVIRGLTTYPPQHLKKRLSPGHK